MAKVGAGSKFFIAKNTDGTAGDYKQATEAANISIPEQSWETITSEVVDQENKMAETLKTVRTAGADFGLETPLKDTTSDGKLLLREAYESPNAYWFKVECPDTNTVYTWLGKITKFSPPSVEFSTELKESWGGTADTPVTESELVTADSNTDSNTDSNSESQAEG